MIKRGKRIKDDANFEKDQKVSFKTLDEKTVYEGEPPPMEKFVEFWAGIWELVEKTPELPWMQKVKMVLREKVKNVK